MFGSSNREKKPIEEKSRSEKTFGRTEKKEKEDKPKKSLSTKSKETRQKLKKVGVAGINIVGSFGGAKGKAPKSNKSVKGLKKSKTPGKRASLFGDPQKGMYKSDMAKKVKGPRSPIGMSSLSGYSTKLTNKKSKW